MPPFLVFIAKLAAVCGPGTLGLNVSPALAILGAGLLAFLRVWR